MSKSILSHEKMEDAKRSWLPELSFKKGPPSSPHQCIPLKQSHMPGTSPLACVAPFCLRFFQPFSLAPSTSFTPTLFINPMMDRCLRKNTHFVDQGDMKIGKQDTQSALLMFWINKALCYRQLFLPIHALTAAIFSSCYKDCLLLAEMKCQLWFNWRRWASRWETLFTRNIFLFIGWCIVCFFNWVFFI